MRCAWLYVEITNTKVVVEDVENGRLWLGSLEGKVDIVDSVIDCGSGGGVFSDGVMTIDNSDVTVRKYEYDDEESEDRPFLGIRSYTDVVLKNEANGEVKEYVVRDGYKVSYVTTGDEDGVFLKAANTPGYYLGTAATKGTAAKSMPQTGDNVNYGIFAGMAIASVVALGALGATRRRGKHEA